MKFRIRIAAPWASRSFRLVSTLLLLASACTPQPISITREPVTLRLAAADSFAPLVEDAATAYEESRPWVTVSTEVLTAALAEKVLRQGGTDLALLSWLGEPGGGGQLWTAGFARDGVAVIVHPASPLTEPGLATLRDIFSGWLQEWNGTVLTVVSREDGSGTRAAFESIVLEGRDTTLNAVVMPSGEAMVEHVASTPGAIGYVSTLWLGQTPSNGSTQGGLAADGVRVLPVEGLLPTERTIGDGSYLLWRQLYLASSGEPTGEAREFAQWLLRGGGLGDSSELSVAIR